MTSCAKRVVLAYSGGLDTSVAVQVDRARSGAPRSIALAVDVGQTRRRRLGDDPPARARRGRGRGDRRRRPRRVRRRLLPPRAPGQRALRGQVPARVGAVAPGDREAPRRRGPRARRRRRRARLHRQGQRPGALRGVDARARARPRRARARCACGASPARTRSTTRPSTTSRSRSRKENPYSIDENIWGRAIECGVLEDPWVAPPGEPYALTTRPAQAPRDPWELVIALRAGRPGRARRRGAAARTSSSARSGRVVGSYGWGRIDMVENRRVGIKSREVYECPGSLALILAHADLESITLERDLCARRRGSSRATPSWSTTACGTRRCARRSTRSSTHTQEHVTGEVRLRLEPGRCYVVGRRADARPLRLRARDLRRRRRVPPRGRRGFVRLWGLGLETVAAPGHEEPPDA